MSEATDRLDEVLRAEDLYLADFVSDTARNALIYWPDPFNDYFTDGDVDDPHGVAKEINELVNTILTTAAEGESGYRWEAREYATNLALSYSLCPLHFCDYASCFDDEDPECATIRAIHPGHDT